MTLQGTLAKARHEISQLKQDNNVLRESLRHVEEQLAWLKRQIFGQKPERTVKDLNSSQPTFEGFDLPKEGTPE